MSGIIRYLIDKLLLGEKDIKERDLDLYFQANNAAPSISSDLISELEQADFPQTLDSRRMWFERAARSVIEHKFTGERLEIAQSLLQSQIDNPFTLPLVYEPEKLSESLKKRFGNKEEYTKHLAKKYAVHLFEDALSLLLSSIHFLSNEVDDIVISEKEKKSFLDEASRMFYLALYTDPGVTPEEHDVLISQVRKRLQKYSENTDDASVEDFISMRLLQDKVIGEVKSAFDPDLGNFGSRFSKIVASRISDTFRKELRMESLDNEESNFSLDYEKEDNFEPHSGSFTPMEANAQIEYFTKVLDEALTKKDKFLFKMKFINEFTHEETALFLSENFASEGDVLASNINYRVKTMKVNFIKALREAGIENPDQVYQELINLLKGKTV